jgi:serine/threonine protein kinase
MGSVYLVYDKQLDTKVALKTLNVSSGLDIYLFKREFRSLADLRHVNLVTLYELISEGKLLFFTMEYVVGVPFDRYLLAQSSSRHSRECMLSTVQQLCAGVHAVHETGCVHRDLKPSNVLVTEAGRVVILDFGLAKHTNAESLSGDGIFGTPAYMAPEQALEKPCLPAADWYAVGTMIYEVLTGRCPFDGALLAVLLKKQAEDPPAPFNISPLADRQLGELCMKLLHRDPAERPTGVDVLAHLGVVSSKRPLVQTGRSPAVVTNGKGVLGREVELAVLDRAYTETLKGRQAVTMVQGTSGIGKTSMVETFIEHRLPVRSTSSPPLVLRGRCHEREALPFKAFDSVVDSLTYHLTKLSDNELSYVLPDGILHLSEIFPVLRRLKLITHERYAVPPLRDAKELRNQAFVAFGDLLVRMARLRPLVIFIDDLQWADLDSFALLRAIMRQPGAPALLLILSSRSLTDGNMGGAKSLLLDVEAQPGVEVMTLGPLTDDNIRTLADDLIDAGQVTPALRQHLAETIVNEARGNPLFVVELVQHIHGMMLPGGGLPASPDGSDFHLDGMILKRVGALPEESRRLLEIIAMAGDPLPQLTLAGAIGVPFGSEAWERGISALVEERLISRRGRQGDDTVVTYHDRIREAVVRRLDEATLRKLHRQLAEAVEEWDHARTDRLARYWLSADDHARAKRYASDAADEARTKLAFDRAAEFYETAVVLESEDKARIPLLQALGECRASSGNASLAAVAYERAAALSDTAHAVRLHHLAAEQLLRGGQIAQGLEVLKDVLKQAGLRLAPGPRRAFMSVAWRLLWLRLRGTGFVERPAASISARNERLLDVLWSVNIGLGVVDILHADDCLLRFLMLALKTGDILRVSQGLSMLAGQIAAIGRSHFWFSMQLLSKAEVLARRSSDPHAIGLTKMCHGVVHYFAGEWDDARNELTAVEQYFLSHCHGVSWELATTRIFACYSLRMAGRLRELCERFDRYTADADRTGDRYLATNLRTYHSIVWLIRDDCARASKDIEGILDAWPGDRYQFQHFTHLFARCEQALYAGRPEAAFGAISAEDARIRRSAMLHINGIRLEYAWLWARIALAMAEGAPQSSRSPFFRRAWRCLRFLRKSDHQTGVAMAAAIEAGVGWLSPGADRSAGLRALEHAVATAEAAGANLLAESGRRWLGEIVGGPRGEDLLARSSGWMAEQGVQNPARLAYMIVPGFQIRSA